MPQFAAYIGITVADLIVVGITIVGTAVSISDSRRAARRMEEEIRRAQDAAEAQDRLARQQAAADSAAGVGSMGREETKTMLKSSKAPRNVVFGTDRVSGPMACFFSFEAAGLLFHNFAVVLAGHECEAIDAIYFNDDEVTLNADGWVTYPEQYTHAGRPLFRIVKHLGQPGQQASQLMIAAAAQAGTPTAWDASRKGTGLCYVTVHMEADWDALHSIGIPNISARVRGVKAYDPRSGLTAYTTNPALLARWWLVNSGYCPATLTSEIDEDELIASANVCDELVEFKAGVFAARYTANGYINSNANPLENLTKILGAMDGAAMWLSGKWQLFAGYYRTPQLHIDESKLGGGTITISPYTPTASLFNAISGQYKGSETKFQASGYGMIAPPEYLLEDGGQVYEKKDDFDLVNEGVRCQMIAWQRLSRARQQLAVNVDCNLKAYDTSPLQNVTLSLAEFGYSNKVFEVRKRTFAGTHIEYSLQETSPAVWDWDYTKTQAAVETPNVNVQVNLTVESLQNIVVTSGTDSLLINNDGTITSRIKVTWDKVTSTYVQYGGFIEWQYRATGAAEWITSPRVSGNSTEAYLSPVIDGVTYEIRGRAISQLGSRGLGSAVITHTVVGKTQPPSNIESFTIDGDVLNWTHITDLDVAGYEIRFNYGNNGDWGVATQLTTGIVTESPFALVTRPSGTVTLMIKAIDTSGNYSYLPAKIITDLGDAPIQNVVETINFDPAFLGTLTDCTLSSGDLLSDATDLFYGANAAAFYGADTDPFYLTSAYSGFVYESTDTRIASALTGSIATLVLDYVGSSLFIEYRLSDPAQFYGEDGDLFYGADGDPFYDGVGGQWVAWPGQIAVTNDIYQFRVTPGGGATQARLNAMALVIDAPDMTENVDDLAVSAAGTLIPYTKNFTSIKNIQATLQTNASSAVTVEVDKTTPLAPTVKCFDVSHVAVSGASVDFVLKGY